MNYKLLYRVFLKATLITGLLISIVITYLAYQNKEWATIASALSVTTAVLAIWISLNLTWHQEDEKHPSLYLFIDNYSHKYAYSLAIKNEGGSAAYNVKIEWINPIYDYDKKEPRFTDFDTDYDFYYLQSGASFSRFLIGADDFRRLCDNTDGPLVYEGVVSYTTSSKNKFRTKQNFKISLEQFKKRLNVMNDQMDFFFENKKLTSQLKDIDKSLQQLIKVLNDKSEK